MSALSGRFLRAGTEVLSCGLQRRDHGLAARPPAEELRRYPLERSVDGLLLALRDGYVRATGRISITRRKGSADVDKMWRLHATDPTLTTTGEWRAGAFDAVTLVLNGPSWQYKSTFRYRISWYMQSGQIGRKATRRPRFCPPAQRPTPRRNST